MAKPAVPPRRLLATVLALTAPAALVLAGFAAADRLPWSGAILGTIAVAAVLAVMAHRHLAGLEALRRQIDDLAHDRPSEWKGPTPLATAAELSSAVAALHRFWAERSERLRALVAVNEAVLDSIPDPIVLLDGERRVKRANAAARELLGAELAGRDFITALRDPAVVEAIDAVLAGGPAQACAFSVPAAVERHFTARIVQLPAGTGEDLAVLLALHDVTGIRRAEQMRADFVANVSHELRTPLATLLGFTETLRGAAREDAEARDRFLAIMHEQASRMSRLVRDLLSLSRIEQVEHTPPTGRIALAPLLGGVADALLLQARAKNVAVTIDVAPDLPEVTGDVDQLAQVFQNLIDNAIKYSRPQGQVRVSARRATHAPATVKAPPSRLLAIAVADEGEGIAREHLSRLTERFYRVDAGRSRQMGGTGLGLAIVKHIVNRHRGALTIESEPGRGSVFTVYLPVASG